jgi:hypothetical protein
MKRGVTWDEWAVGYAAEALRPQSGQPEEAGYQGISILGHAANGKSPHLYRATAFLASARQPLDGYSNGRQATVAIIRSDQSKHIQPIPRISTKCSTFAKP